MRINSLARCLLAAALAAAPLSLVAAALAPLEKIYIAEAGGTLEVGPDGSVVAVTVEEAIAEPLRSRLAASIGKLRFAPIHVGGQAVRALTGFHVRLAAHAKGDALEVQIDGIDFATPKGMTPVPVDGEREGPKALEMGPPRFPEQEQRSGRMARVEIALRVGADGRVADAQVVDSMLIDNGNKFTGDSTRALAHFERATLDAARGWTFKLPANGSALAPSELTVKTNVEYVFDLRNGFDLHKHGQWLPMYRAPKRAVAWLPAAEASRVAETAVAAGGVSNPANPFRLLAPVAGTPVL